MPLQDAQALRDLARDLRDIAKRSPAYSMVARPGLDIISVLEDHLCAMARIIELDNMIVTAPVAEQALLRKLEAMLADWDSDGGETYLDFAKRLLRCFQEEDTHNLPKKDTLT